MMDLNDCTIEVNGKHFISTSALVEFVMSQLFNNSGTMNIKTVYDHLVDLVPSENRLTHLIDPILKRGSTLSLFIGKNKCPTNLKMCLTLASLVVTSVMCYGLFRLFTWYVKRRRLYELASRLKGPLALPILGNSLQLLGDGEHVMNFIKKCDKLYPSPYPIWIGPVLMIVITDPDQVSEMWLNPSTLGKGEVFSILAGTLVGDGILSAPVPQWRAHRKIIQPTFGRKILESFCEIFATQSKIFTEIIGQNVDGPEFEVFKLLSACTLDMVGETVMGVKINAQTDKECRYVEALQQVIGSGSVRFFNFWLYPDFIFNRTKIGRDHQNNLKYLHEFTENVIEMKRRELDQSESHHATAVDDEDDMLDWKRNIKATLHRLMTSGDGGSQLSDKQLRDEVDTLVIAGNDTSAIVLDFTILMLASHPDIQDTVYEELYEIYGDADIDDRPVKSEDLVDMKYLERVIKETMRLFPVAPFLLREMSEEMNVGEHTLPKGSNVVIGIHSIHRREDHWPDPLKFDPDRFLPEECAKRHPYAYMPFSNGARNCIGRVYAMMSMKTLLATVLRRYILKKDNPTPIKDIRTGMEILMKPVEPITVRIERRTRN